MPYYTSVADVRHYRMKEVSILVNTVLLRKQLNKRSMTISDLAAAMGIDKATLYRRIAAPETFTIGEALKIARILNLPHADSTAIFFANEVA